MPPESHEPARRPPFAAAPRRVWAAPVLAALVGFLAGDALRPPDEQLTARAAVAAIDGYRAALSPAVGKVVRCRFQPTCSAYALEALHHHGPLKGLWLTAKRLSRCHPISWLGGSSGFDPVPYSKRRPNQRQMSP